MDLIIFLRQNIEAEIQLLDTLNGQRLKINTCPLFFGAGATATGRLSSYQLCTQFPPICSFSGVEDAATPQLLRVQESSILRAALCWNCLECSFLFTSNIQQPPAHPQSLLRSPNYSVLKWTDESWEQRGIKLYWSHHLPRMPSVCGSKDVFYVLCLCVWVVKWVSVFRVCVYMCMCVLDTQSCLILCNTMDYSLPGFPVHGIL